MRKADYFEPAVKPQVSGCVFFRGEDLEEEQRKKQHQAEQKAYLLRQMEENKQKKELEAKQNSMYDMQRLAVADQVGINHREFTQRNLAVQL